MSAASNTPSPQERRLAAILFTDVVGYSSAMQRNEAGTMALVSADLKSMTSLCQQCGGEVMNSMGDGLMMCFPSAVHAVDCALQIQQGFSRRSASEAGPPLTHRIGIHLGDVLVQDGQMAGDGVNIASRLEGQASAGGICASQTIVDIVRGKLPMEIVRIGPLNLKNISAPVTAYSIWPPGSAPTTRKPTEARKKSRWLRLAIIAALVLLAALGVRWGFGHWNRPVDRSLAILPFSNLSKDMEHDYLCEGIGDEVGIAMANTGLVKVVARSSAYAFKGKSLDVRETARQLGVEYLLEGRLHSIDNRVLRVTAELVKATDGYRVWSKSLTGDAGEIQNEIIRALCRELLPADRAEMASGGQVATNIPEAYDHYLRGRHAYTKWTIESLERANAELNSAISLDPDYGAAWALLAEVMITQDDLFRRQLGGDRPDPYPAVLAAATRAEQAARPARGEAHAVRAHVFIHQLKFREAELESLQAVALSPNSSNAHQWFGHVLWLKGRLPEARRELDRSLSLEIAFQKRAELWLRTLRVFLVYTGQAEEGAQVVSQLAGLGDGPPPLHQQVLIAIQRRQISEARTLLAQHEQARLAKEKADPSHANSRNQIEGDGSEVWLRSYLEATAGNLTEAKRLLATKVTAPGPVLLLVLAQLAVGDTEAALQSINDSPPENILGVFYQRHLPEYRQLAGHPRWQAILKKVGLH